MIVALVDLAVIITLAIGWHMVARSLGEPAWRPRVRLDGPHRRRPRRARGLR